MVGGPHISDLPKDNSWWEEHKIVLLHTDPEGPTGDVAFGDTPEAVVDLMKCGSFYQDERDDRDVYMAEVQFRMAVLGTTFLYHDAESFLFGMIKAGAMSIAKWEWEPDETAVPKESSDE